MNDDELVAVFDWSQPPAIEGGAPWFNELTADTLPKLSIAHGTLWRQHLTLWRQHLREANHQANTLRTLADLPGTLTPAELRLAADMLDTWKGTLPELLATITEITAPKQVSE